MPSHGGAVEPEALGDRTLAIGIMHTRREQTDGRMGEGAATVTERPIRLLIAAGGTGGHVSPAVAVITELRERGALGDTLWIGSHAGVEGHAASAHDIPFRAIQTGKLRRYVSPRTLVDAARLPVGLGQAWRIVRQFAPDVVLSTGGFVSVPTVIAASRVAPVLTHEQTAIVGLANRINARFAGTMAVSFAQTAISASTMHDRVIVTGNPVRSNLANGDPDRALSRWGFRRDLPLVYITGGARGASPLNQRIGALLPALLEHCQILHQVGPASANRDATRLTDARKTWTATLQRRYQVVAYVGDELADVYAAASLVVSRAGAGTIAELAALGKPSILIPLPGAGGDEQTRNAQLLTEIGGAILLPQHQADPNRLRTEILDLLNDPERRTAMGSAAATVGHGEAAGNLADALLVLAKDGINRNRP